MHSLASRGRPGLLGFVRCAIDPRCGWGKEQRRRWRPHRRHDLGRVIQSRPLERQSQAGESSSTAIQSRPHHSIPFMIDYNHPALTKGGPTNGVRSLCGWRFNVRRGRRARRYVGVYGQRPGCSHRPAAGQALDLDDGLVLASGGESQHVPCWRNRPAGSGRPQTGLGASSCSFLASCAGSRYGPRAGRASPGSGVR